MEIPPHTVLVGLKDHYEEVNEIKTRLTTITMMIREVYPSNIGVSMKRILSAKSQQPEGTSKTMLTNSKLT